ncbi:hypothetical protein KUTeg_013844 [Tegillarca granosa]|uniref:MHD domain-containing protein n=1 Tax=Tegillarca granosa TaxID=220873 RepID=A0ABQ9F004_TEGGR|nr:hypothetical protein KUTeg_013844 [Tegillarca granosa]
MKISECLYRKNRCDSRNDSKETFIQKLKNNKNGQLPPHFEENGICFYFVKKSSLYFVATSRTNVSPILVIEILTRIQHVLKDFLGVITEESVRANNLLVMEILDDIMDNGYVQLASTEKLRPYIQSNTVISKSTREPTKDIGSRMFGIEMRVAPGTASNKPVIGPTADQGTPVRLEVNGAISMKNFLSGGSAIKLALNEDLSISSGDSLKAYGTQVQLDKCTFHSCVKLDLFEESRVLLIQPPVGEVPVLTYSVSGDVALNLPFKLSPFVSDLDGSRDLMLTLRLKSEIPSNTSAVNVVVIVPVSRNVNSVSQHLSGPGQTAEYISSDKKILWKIKKFPGKTEMIAQFRLINQTSGQIHKQDIGPAVLEFEVSGYTCSGLLIRYLKMPDRENARRWMRYITVADSYVIKLVQ